MYLFRKNIFVTFFQTFSASDLLPRITASCYARSAGSLLLLLPPSRHSPGSWDISGDVEGVRPRSQERQQTGLLLQEQTQTHLLPPPQRGAESSPEAAFPQGNGDTPQDWARLRLPALREGASCQKTHSHMRLPISREVKEKGWKPREIKVLKTLQSEQPDLQQGKAGRGRRILKEKKHLNEIIL